MPSVLNPRAPKLSTGAGDLLEMERLDALDERCRGILDYATVTTDRIEVGGSYRRSNCQPSCAPCQSYQGHLVSTGQWVAS